MCLVRPASWRPALTAICPGSFEGRHALLRQLQVALKNDAGIAYRGGALLGVGGAGGVPELVGVGGGMDPEGVNGGGGSEVLAGGGEPPKELGGEGTCAALKACIQAINPMK